MEIIAHRGAGHSGQNPLYRENTWPALATAVARGYDVGLDVRVTKDGHGVISREDSLVVKDSGGPMGIRHFSIEKTTLTDLQKAGAVATGINNPNRVTLLDSVLEHLTGRTRLYLEFKTESGPGALAESMNRLKLPVESLRRSLSLNSFFLSVLRDCKSRWPTMERCWLNSTLISGHEAQRHFEEYNLSAFHLALPLANAKIVDWLQRNLSVVVRVFDVNNLAAARELSRMCVNGIFTDHPDAMR
jgi:glycerophosphoryl diester phosphodiesterase